MEQSPEPPSFQPPLPAGPPATDWIKITLLVLLGAGVIGASIIFGMQLGKNQSANTQPSATPTMVSPSETPISQPTKTTAKSDESWKTFTAQDYSFRYPGTWILEEKCTKKGYSSNYPCLYTANFQPVTKKVEPGDGGSDLVTEYNIGILLEIKPLSGIPYDSSRFCAPGGPVTIENCNEKTINGIIFATREMGTSPYPANSIDAWAIVDKQGAAELTFNYSKENKKEDLRVFDQILASFKFIK